MANCIVVNKNNRFDVSTIINIANHPVKGIQGDVKSTKPNDIDRIPFVLRPGETRAIYPVANGMTDVQVDCNS